MPPRKYPTREGFYSRRDLSERCRVTIRTIENWHSKGIITGERGDNGLYWYTAAELAEAAAYVASSGPVSRGERTARAFEMFRDGSALVDVVIELRITTPAATQLFREYSPGGGCMGADVFGELLAGMRRRGIVANDVPSFRVGVLALLDAHAQLERLRVGGAV